MMPNIGRHTLAVRMGRLAVAQHFKGQGLGGALLADALDRCARSEIAAYALVADAKDQAAASFYQHPGFIALLDLPLALFLPWWQFGASKVAVACELAIST